MSACSSWEQERLDIPKCLPSVANGVVNANVSARLDRKAMGIVRKTRRRMRKGRRETGAFVQMNEIREAGECD